MLNRVSSLKSFRKVGRGVGSSSAPSKVARRVESQVSSRSPIFSKSSSPKLLITTFNYPTINVERYYATNKSTSSDLFASALEGTKGENMPDAVVKPRIPVQKPRPKKLRKHYKHQDFLESMAHLRKVPVSMLRIYHLARAIRRLPVSKAMRFLEIYPTRAAKRLFVAVRSAKCNAVWRGFREEDLIVSRVVIGKGKFLKRMMTHAKGRAGRVEHPFHHISVYVRPSEQAIREDAEAKKQAKLGGKNQATTEKEQPTQTQQTQNKEQKSGGWWPFGSKAQTA